MSKNKEYQKAWRESHKKQQKDYMKAYYKAHRDKLNDRQKAYYQSHREEVKDRVKAWRESHQEDNRAYHRNYNKAYEKMNLNSSGKPKRLIRKQSRNYLSRHGTKIPGYQIHHCCTYDEPYKFIYCPKEIHLQIHNYLRKHNIPADSEHFEQIKHLLDDSVVLYGIPELDK